MNFLSTCRAIALFASAFACAIASVPSVHAEAAATTSLTDIPYAVDPGFPLVSRRDVIVGGSSVGATALIELAPGGDVILGGLVSGSLVLQRVAPDGTRGSWPVTTAANPGLLQLDPPAGAPYLGVSDIKVFDNRLFVLVDRQRSSSVTTRDVYVLVFGVDGTFLSSYLAMGDFRDEHGAGLAIYQTFGIGVPTTTFVSVVGHRALDAVESNPFLTRARLQGDSLVRDTTIGDANGYVQLPVPGALCAPYNEACSMEVARTVVKPTGAFGTTPILYVAGSIRTSGDDWDYALLCISASGTPCSDFGNGGFVRRGFNNGGSLADRATDIAVRRFGTFGAYVYTVYLTGNVARRCQGGVGAMAFDGSDGSVEFGFGLLGRVLVGGHDGGSGGTPICFLNDGPDLTEGAAFADGHLFIGGARVYTSFDGDTWSDVQTLVLDAAGNVVDPLRAHDPSYPPDLQPTPFMSSAVRAVSADGSGRFLVAGQSYTPDSPYPSAFIAGRFARDRIFGSGYD
ncbi:MAG: hypothetical protein J0L88_05320 [Xanthomonadales bacterium]|nr:hypothetical protein [Xanthomonadales bacterium]